MFQYKGDYLAVICGPRVNGAYPPAEGVSKELVHHGVRHIIYVSVEDRMLIHKSSLTLSSGYPAFNGFKRFHQMVIGKRPADVPDDWVIHHEDCNPMNNTRENLSWVSRRFNAWCVRRTKTSNSTSCFRGVSKNKDKWQATFCCKVIGYFDTELEAARAYVKACIREFGDRVCTCHILVGDEPGKFTPDEMTCLLKESSTKEMVKSDKKYLPKGVTMTPKGTYWAIYRKKRLGVFDTWEKAEEAYTDAVRTDNLESWKYHLTQPISRDNVGHAVIALTGIGEGLFTKVPEQFWHLLTFKNKWCYDGKYARGTWNNKGTALHQVVYKLLHPNYKKTRKFSIDHVIPGEKLDNRNENLDLKDASGQARNKAKRTGCTSKYIGVSKAKNGWAGRVCFQGKTHRVYAKTEDEAYVKLCNLKRTLGIAF